MWVKVIEATIADLQGATPEIPLKERARWCKDALRWISSNEFDRLCESLDLEPRRVRMVLKQRGLIGWLT